MLHVLTVTVTVSLYALECLGSERLLFQTQQTNKQLRFRVPKHSHAYKLKEGTELPWENTIVEPLHTVAGLQAQRSAAGRSKSSDHQLSQEDQQKC